MMSPFGQERDIYYMKAALLQAQKAFDRDEVPVGAVIVNAQGVIVARAHNYVERRSTQAAHAEVIALTKAGKRLNSWRLEGHWLYVTLEPCSMCMSVSMLSRLAGVVYGASSPLFGNHLDKNALIPLYKKDAMSIITNVCSQESALLLRTFFQNKRKKSG